MDIVTLVRITVGLTFLILAGGGPYAIIKLRQFIDRYATAHAALEARVKALEVRITALEQAGETR